MKTATCAGCGAPIYQLGHLGPWWHYAPEWWGPGVSHQAMPRMFVVTTTTSTTVPR